jgi:prepilin-type N-terminal cleavage/methylation domain-containing protein
VRRPARGFTLIELLVTLAIIAILMGIGLGILSRFGKKDALEATTYGVRALLRRARNAAEEERCRTLVEVDPKASELRAQTHTTITCFRFELGGGAGGDDGDAGDAPAGAASPAPAPAPAAAPPASGDDALPPPFEVPGALGYTMQVDGAEVVKGRYGTGLGFEREGAWASIEDRPALSPTEGISVQLWMYLGVLDEALRDPRARPPERTEQVKLRAAQAGDPPRPATERRADWKKRAPDAPPLFVAARKGKAWSLAVTPDYALEVALTGPDEQGTEVTFISRTAPNVLRADRWYHVALEFDGHRCQLVVDGIPRHHLPDPGHEALPTRLLRDRSPLSLSDPDPERSFYGVLDELEVQAVLAAQRVLVPQDVLIVCPEDAVAFDALGQLDPGRHAEPIVIYLTDDPRAYALVDPPKPGEAAGGTQTRADQAAARALVGATPYQRLVKGLGALDPTRWRAVVVERTGLVR